MAYRTAAETQNRQVCWLGDLAFLRQNLSRGSQSYRISGSWELVFNNSCHFSLYFMKSSWPMASSHQSWCQRVLLISECNADSRMNYQYKRRSTYCWSNCLLSVTSTEMLRTIQKYWKYSSFSILKHPPIFQSFRPPLIFKCCYLLGSQTFFSAVRVYLVTHHCI